MRSQARNPFSNGLNIAVMAAALCGSIVLYFWLFDTPLMEVFKEWTAQTTGLALGLIGTDVDISGTTVASDSFAYRIVTECTAVGPLLLYAAVVLTYPVGFRSKMLGLMFGSLIIGGLNLIRLVSLFYVGTYWREHLGELHLLFWQGAMMLSVVILWLYWLRRWDRVAKA